MTDERTHHVTLKLTDKFRFVADFADVPGASVVFDEPQPLGDNTAPNAAEMLSYHRQLSGRQPDTLPAAVTHRRTGHDRGGDDACRAKRTRPIADSGNRRPARAGCWRWHEHRPM